MNVKIAKESGFCFGVKRAMKMAWNELEASNDGIYALGPLIHNKQAVQKYEEKGLKTVDKISDVPPNNNMIIRSHGVAETVYNESKKRCINLVDTTCPFVTKIHRIVKKYYKNGYSIIVVGDENHPEVIGINGWCENSAIVIKNIDTLNNISFDKTKKYCLVSQTTINLDLYIQIVEFLSQELEHVLFNNTICSATKVRQEAANKLSKEVDVMVVIGGTHSSNTQKLVNICKKVVPTFAIETKSDLNIDLLKNFKDVGITAGASTPNWIIDDVVEFIKSI
ncbi:MAG: 4-hydroxy-3-methylbut-2-enyl diphosphate reductase [Romboutsia sp.]